MNRTLAELNEIALGVLEAFTDSTNILIDLRTTIVERQRIQDWILEHMPDFFLIQNRINRNYFILNLYFFYYLDNKFSHLFNKN